jgi:streptogramin lyase
MYFTAGNAIGRVDPKTERFEFFHVPPDLKGGVGQDLDVAPDGAIWATTGRGAFRLDPVTRAWKHFRSVNVFDGGTYGVAADADSNGWWTQFNVSRLGKGDVSTGRTLEVVLQPPWLKHQEDTRTPEDKRFYESIGAEANGGINMVPEAMAPRRMGADKNGQYVYVANFNGENVVRVHIRTLETTYFKMPIQTHPYRVVVDKHHNAWASSMGDDWLMRLDAKTEQWSLYQLPILNCDTRYVVSDHVRDEIWVPCGRTSSVVRMQFRTPAQMSENRSAALPILPPTAVAVQPASGPLPKADPADPTVTRSSYDMKLVVQPGPLTDDEVKGRNLFYGRCGICHTRPSGPWIDQMTMQSRGEATVRKKILEGSTLMPGQRYSLSPAQVDQLIAYLKVRTAAEKPQTPIGWW